MAFTATMTWVAHEAMVQLYRHCSPSALQLAKPTERIAYQLSVPIRIYTGWEQRPPEVWSRLLWKRMGEVAHRMRIHGWTRLHELPVELPGVHAQRVTDTEHRISLRLV